MTTGQIIKQLREERGMTQEQLAELMGYSHKSSINKIELGKSDLPQSKLVKFAKIFGVSPCDLLGYVSTPTTDEQISPDIIAIEQVQNRFGKDAVRLLELFTKLNDLGKEKALEDLDDLTNLPKYTEKGEQQGLLNA